MEIAETIETLLEPGPLDDLLESEAPLEPLFGRYAAWNGQAFPIVPMLETLAIRVSLPCAKCGRSHMIAYALLGAIAGHFVMYTMRKGISLLTCAIRNTYAANAERSGWSRLPLYVLVIDGQPFEAFCSEGLPYWAK